jgi:hypothetical protein
MMLLKLVGAVLAKDYGKLTGYGFFRIMKIFKLLGVLIYQSRI